MESKYTLIQAIGVLSTLQGKDIVFQRVNDRKFEIFRTYDGCLRFRINSQSDEFRVEGELKLFNYLNDKFIIKDIKEDK